MGHLRLEQWTSFLSFDDDSRATLLEFYDLIAPHIDRFMDTLYARIGVHDCTAPLFPTPEVMAHARARQREHWLSSVFVGRFDEAYLKRAVAIGKTHFRLGVDPRLYSGTYLILLNEVIAVATAALVDRPEALVRYLTALNRAVFLDMGLATSVYHDTVVAELEEMSVELNFSLARAGEFRDNETGRHIIRMSRMCEVLALKVGQDAKWAQMVRVASPLHDVGKIGIPDSILLKPGRLAPDELTVMRTHASIGGEIIPDHSAEVISMARRIALTHHERWDGQGYPAGLKGEEIPLEGRIAAICDVYDALVSDRPYKVAWTREQALEHLRENAGGHFDPALVAAFLSVMAEVDAIQQHYADRPAVSACPVVSA